MADIFLSDVHIYTDNKKCQCPEDDFSGVQSPPVVSRFEFCIKPRQANSSLTNSSQLHDEDGDLVVERKSDWSKEVINLYHTMATPLPLVGLQVWRGALLLADYLLCSGEDILKDKIVLELGAGTGLCSLVAALSARCVFATDTGDTVLELCHKNCSQNKQIAGGRMAPIVTKELDWKQKWLFEPTESRWGWLSEDMEHLSKCTILLAADIVYDNDISDAFLNTVNRICQKLPISTMYLALEKRLNFTLDDLDVACPAYTYFFEKLDNCHFISDYKQVPTTFPLSFNYERVDELELWEISLHKR